MASGAAEMVFQFIFDASLSNFESMERRPYHRNCSCALHKLKGTDCSTCYNSKYVVSFPKKKQFPNHYSFSITAPTVPSQSSLSREFNVRSS